MILAKLYLGLTLAMLAWAGPILEKNSAKNDFCQDVNAIVFLLKINKATPFCSSFLGIHTVTLVPTSTSVILTTTIYPAPTFTTTVTTSTETLTSTGTLSLTTTTISTSQIYTTNVLVITATVSTTIVATLRKREPETAATEVNRRGNLPAWIAVFASSKISTACNCLSIPTPTVTSTTVTSTSKTIFSTSPTVTLDINTLALTTIPVTGTSISTEVDLVTITSPTTVSTTTTTTAVSTSTYIPPPCLNPALVNNGYFPAINRQFNIVPISNGYTAQRCCARCYETPNCILWAWGGFIAPDLSSCYSVLGTDQAAAAPIALQGICPLGISATSNLAISEGANMEGEYAAGPCDQFGLQFET